MHYEQKVKVAGYGPSVETRGLTIDLMDGGDLLLELYPHESKALRKALKRAEQTIAEARR